MIMNNTDLASYADDNTPYAVGNNIEELIVKLQNTSKTLFQWFGDNQMKSNPDNCNFICSTSKKVSLIVENKEINNKRLLGVKIDSKLSFNTHIDNICKKTSLKLNALSRITPHWDFKKKKLLINSCFMSQFNYCQLIWMCHNLTKNNKINRLHERCLRLLYNDKISSFHILLEKDGSVSIHHRNLRALPTEMYRIYNSMAPEIFRNFPQGQCNLRSWSNFTVPIVRTVNYGTESIRFLGPKIWESVPADIKEVDTIERFKSGIKK